MKDRLRKFSILLLLLVPGSLRAMLLDPTQEPGFAPQQHWSVRSANGQTPQQDYTLPCVLGGSDILTGGPLAFGPPLAGITDITGPDGAWIAAFLDSRAGLQALSRHMGRIARFVHHEHPPLPMGVLGSLGRPDMVDLRPQHIWLMPHPNAIHEQDNPLCYSTVPETSTLTLLALGGWILRRRTKQH